MVIVYSYVLDQTDHDDDDDNTQGALHYMHAISKQCHGELQLSFLRNFCNFAGLAVPLPGEIKD